MILKLDIVRVWTIDEVREFMAGSEPVDFHFTDQWGVRLRDADRKTAELRGVEQGGQAGRTSLCGEGHGVVAGAEHAADWSVPEDWAHPGPAVQCDAPV